MSAQRLMWALEPRDCQSVSRCDYQHGSVVICYSSMGNSCRQPVWVELDLQVVDVQL